MLKWHCRYLDTGQAHVEADAGEFGWQKYGVTWHQGEQDAPQFAADVAAMLVMIMLAKPLNP